MIGRHSNLTQRKGIMSKHTVRLYQPKFTVHDKDVM